MYPCVIKDFHLLLRCCRHLCCWCRRLCCTEVGWKGCTTTHGESCSDGVSKLTQEKQHFVEDAPGLFYGFFVQEQNTWRQGNRRAQQESLQQTPLSLVQNPVSGSQRSFKSMATCALQRDLSCQSAQAQLDWDHTQQFVWGQLPEPVTCQGFVCSVTRMGKSPLWPYERFAQCCTWARLGAALVYRSPSAFLPVLHSSFVLNLLSESSPPGRRVVPSNFLACHGLFIRSNEGI